MVAHSLLTAFEHGAYTTDIVAVACAASPARACHFCPRNRHSVCEGSQTGLRRAADQPCPSGTLLAKLTACRAERLGFRSPQAMLVRETRPGGPPLRPPGTRRGKIPGGHCTGFAEREPVLPCARQTSPGRQPDRYGHEGAETNVIDRIAFPYRRACGVRRRRRPRPARRRGRGQEGLQGLLVDLCRLDALGLHRRSPASWTSTPRNTASMSRSCRSTTMSS